MPRTTKPRSASVMAISRPMPWVAPVTTAIFRPESIVKKAGADYNHSHHREENMAKSWLFDLVHYPFDPDPERYDPRKAVEVFDDHLRAWEEADRLGFDGLWLGEHHFTAYNMTPSPKGMLAAGLP